ncbi:hypothetical protein [Candidatus Mycoplasma haematohominis]|uniref:Uncharacterized protein n=1 Tax=Candidatus Mycoplasma haematohominis TaxID=1494318 RepID=A0A478FQ27_9MOLU|nr:hypothetical protein [Candidatus Mycoplasma haemohominis]GCE63638.1 hypothetical protein MHSWG343_06350 [Candidatus Mycoplasma haemohominis]
MDPLKAGICAGSAALAIGGGIGISLMNREPFAYTLNSSEAVTVAATYTNGNLGAIQANKTKLVADIEKNKNWFEWIYKNELEPKKTKDSKASNELSSEFQAVTKGYGKETNDTSIALNKVCDSAYKKSKTDFETEANKIKYKSDVEKFCVYGSDKSLNLE